jgi:hypothetical protein
MCHPDCVLNDYTFGLPSTGYGGLIFGVGVRGPIAQYRINVYDSTSGALLISSTSPSYPYVYYDVTPRGFPNLIMIGSWYFAPSVQQFIIRLPQERSNEIRQGIMYWYTASQRYASDYAGQPLSQMYPVTFTVDGLNSTGTENMIVRYESNVAAGDAACAAKDSDGWCISGVIRLDPAYKSLSIPSKNLVEITEHEFGHQLGLGDLYLYPHAPYELDIMTGSDTSCITTFDIYVASQVYSARYSSPLSLPFGFIDITSSVLPNGVPYVCMGPTNGGY